MGQVYLMCQPVAYMNPDTGPEGYIELAEFPFALESRVCTRWDAHEYAKRAHDMGVRYIGGCCGFEACHIRAISEELAPFRNGKVAPGSEKHLPWGEALRMSAYPMLRARVGKEYWGKIKPTSGRP